MAPRDPAVPPGRWGPAGSPGAGRARPGWRGCWPAVHPQGPAHRAGRPGPAAPGAGTPCPLQERAEQHVTGKGQPQPRPARAPAPAGAARPQHRPTAGCNIWSVACAQHGTRCDAREDTVVQPQGRWQTPSAHTPGKDLCLGPLGESHDPPPLPLRMATDPVQKQCAKPKFSPNSAAQTPTQLAWGGVSRLIRGGCAEPSL